MSGGLISDNQRGEGFSCECGKFHLDEHGCSDCQCEHEASVIGGVVPPLESPPLQSLKEVESTRVEDEDYHNAD